MNRSPRTLVLVAILAAAAVAFLVTAPQRARMRRETERLKQEATVASEQARSVRTVRDEEAVARKRVEAEPNSAAAHLALASALGRQRHYQAAMEQASDAARVEPNNPEAHLALGELMDATGRADLAVAEYRKALELDPQYQRALPLLAYKYVAFGWNQEAEALLRRAIRKIPDDPRLHVALGLVYFQNSRLGAAEKELLVARKLAPDDSTILGPLIQTYRQAARYDEALKVADEALKALPNNPSILLEKAHVCLDRHDPAGALAAADQALQTQPDQLRALYLRAVAEKLLNRPQEATADFERVRAQEPRMDKTLFQLGQLYLQAGQREKGNALITEYNRNLAASEDLLRMTLRVASKPNDPDAHRDLGRYYLNAGSYPRAIVEFKRVLEMRPGDVATRSLLARALTAAGRADEAANVGKEP